MGNHGNKIKKEDFAAILKSAIDSTDSSTYLKTGFRSCGLYPFHEDSMNLKRLIKQTQPITLTENADKIENSEAHLSYLESFIDNSVLCQFKECESFWNGDIEYKALFDVWSLIKNKEETSSNEIQNIEQNTSIDILSLENFDQVWLENLFNDCDDEALTLNFSTENPNRLDFDVNQNCEVTEPAEAAQCSTEQLKENSASEKCDEVLPVGVPGTSGLNIAQKPQSLDSLISPFKKAFFYMEECEMPKEKIRPKFKMPIVTSSEWVKFHKTKQQEKENLIKIKEEKRLQRLQKSTERKEKLKPKPKIKAKESKTKTDQNEIYGIGTHVIFIYELEYFPGKITDVKDNKFQISSMQMYIGGKWRWPEKPDIIWYDRAEILEIINSPEHTKRGMFIVPEIRKYQQK